MLKIYSNGNRLWKNEKGELHREDGPAVECFDGTKYWYMNGKEHRIDGPALEWGGGDKEWYLNGKAYTEEEAYKEKVDEIC